MTVLGRDDHGEDGNGEEGHGEDVNGSGFVSARKDAHASGRNTIPSRIHADRARAVGRCDRHRLNSGWFPAPRGRGSGNHPR